MKKVLGISLVAVFAVVPLMANAAVGDIVPGDPAVLASANPAQSAAQVTASNAPKYALKTAKASDGNVATAGYVKGAYNSAIKAINKTVDMLDDGVAGYDIDAKTLKVQGTDVATQPGVVNTINSAVITSELTNAGDVSISTEVSVMDDWGSDEPAEEGIPITAKVNLSGVGVQSTISVEQYTESEPEPEEEEEETLP